jgi:hypothetical protein
LNSLDDGQPGLHFRATSASLLCTCYSLGGVPSGVEEDGLGASGCTRRQLRVPFPSSLPQHATHDGHSGSYPSSASHSFKVQQYRTPQAPPESRHLGLSNFCPLSVERPAPSPHHTYLHLRRTSHSLGHIQHLPVNDHPTIVLLVVLRHLLLGVLPSGFALLLGLWLGQLLLLDLRRRFVSRFRRTALGGDRFR